MPIQRDLYQGRRNLTLDEAGYAVMSKLVKLDEYALITFDNISQALKAQKVLMEAGADFLLIPVPREISASCGLALKARQEEISLQRNLLLQKKVAIKETYRVEPVAKGRRVTRISPADGL